MGRVLYDIVGNVESIIGTLQDFTDRKEQEEENAALTAQLLHSQKLELVGKLASGISHDFSNLLQVLDGNVHLLMMTIPENSEYQKFLKRIEDISISAREMIHQITNFSGQLESKFEVINPAQAIKNIFINSQSVWLHRVYS